MLKLASSGINLRKQANPSGVYAIGLSVAMVMTLAGCGSSPNSAGGGGGEIGVGLITKTDTNPFFVKMKDGATKEASAKGAKLQTAAGKFDGDNASQVTAIENMVASGVKGILITPSDTQSAVDALFATNNFKAGELIGQYAKAAFGSKPATIATLDLKPGITVGVLRHNGFLNGFGAATVDQSASNQVSAPQVVCSNDTEGDQAKGQTAMENCLQKDPGINLIYTI